jgi:uncharacterized membrane protein YphA (DoxX/SURF4 family)
VKRMNKNSRNETLDWVFTLTRVFIGWHFLYEGLIKVFGNWSAESYLLNTRGFLSGFYHALAQNPSLLDIVNGLNAWGLLLIGLALFLGVFTRLAGISGILLLMLYFLAYIPLGYYNRQLLAEGNYLLINKSLIEAMALLVLVLLPRNRMYGLGQLLNLARVREKKRVNSPSSPGQDGKEKYARRDVLKNLVSLPALGLFGLLWAREDRGKGIDGSTGSTIQVNRQKLSELKGQVPKGELGERKVSRIIMGSNLIGGYAHSRDLHYVPSLFKAYNTEKKIYETFSLAEQCGINTTFMTTKHSMYFTKYKKLFNTGLETINQCYLPEVDFFADIQRAIDYGASSLYIQGHYGDIFVQKGETHKLGEAIEYMKSQGYPAGIGAHSIEVIKACEAEGINPDFYVKTFHHDNYWSAIPRENRQEFMVDNGKYPDHDKFHDNIFDIFPEQTVSFMEQVQKPFVAFKVLAAGAIQPEDGFRWAFENGADFICVGMFDFQVVQNANIVHDIFSSEMNRKRNWYA